MSRKPSGAGLVVGENLRRIREQRRWTQEEMAHHLRQWGLGWSRAYLAAYEAGHRDGIDVAVVSVLSAALGVPLGDLYPPPAGRRHVATERQEADAALAERRGLPVQHVMAVARRIYEGRTLTEERDLRVQTSSVGESMSIGERQARRGHITRELAKEVEAALCDLA
jgi:transcriptional regulator with XRE-family HTH domain